MNTMLNASDWSNMGAAGWIIIPIVAIIGWVTFLTLATYWKYRHRTSESASPELRRTLDANTEATRAVLAKLDALDQRLATVEKTLTDIP
jgi:heme/copper-type cytochrome/quinol oxidase subunit 2